MRVSSSSSFWCKMTVMNTKAYVAMIMVQFIYAGMALLSKLAISQGISPFVFVVYRQAFAVLVLAPFAFFLESSKTSPLSYILIIKIFFLSLFGLTLTLNLYYVAINYTTATFAAATTNAIPCITFIIALFFRLESVCLKKSHGVAKVLGSVVGVSGALVFAFVKGPRLRFMNANYRSSDEKETADSWGSHSTQDWIKGSIIMLSANTAWCLWLILQTMVMKQYPAKLRFVTLQCFFSCTQSAVWAVAVDTNPSAWKLQFGLPLLSVAYCGIVVTGITYWLQVWTIEKKGPVFTALFAPLSLVITCSVSTLFLKETLHLGSVCGAVLLVSGLYSVLWGKNREEAEKQTHVSTTKPAQETEEDEAAASV